MDVKGAIQFLKQDRLVNISCLSNNDKFMLTIDIDSAMMVTEENDLTV